MYMCSIPNSSDVKQIFPSRPRAISQLRCVDPLGSEYWTLPSHLPAKACKKLLVNSKAPTWVTEFDSKYFLPSAIEGHCCIQVSHSYPSVIHKKYLGILEVWGPFRSSYNLTSSSWAGPHHLLSLGYILGYRVHPQLWPAQEGTANHHCSWIHSS